MLSIPALPQLDVEGTWQTTRESWSRLTGTLRLRRRDTDVLVRVERCAAGRLRDAYPVAAHDVELALESDQRAQTVPALLRTLLEAVRVADPRCRRVVYAVGEGDRVAQQHAEAVGFRFVVDVDLQDRQLSLLVHEPEWVTRTDTDLGHLPGT